MNSKIKGYALGVLASVAYGTNPALALPLYNEGLDVMSVLLLRYMMALPVVLLLWRLTHGRSRLAESPRQAAGAFVLGILMVLSSITLFASYLYMDVGVASSLLFVYPLLVAIIMAMFFGEQLGIITVVCLVGACCGVAMLCETSGSSVVTATGILLVILSALSYALYLVGVRLKPVSSMDSISLTVWVVSAGVVVLAVWCAVNGRLILPKSLLGWMCAFGLGLLPTLISLLCTNAAIDKIGSTATASLGAFEPVTAVFLGAVLFDERMSLMQYTGLVIVIVCVTMVIMRNRKRVGLQTVQ